MVLFLLRCSDGKACMVHSIWIAELKFGINIIDIGVWRVASGDDKLDLNLV